MALQASTLYSWGNHKTFCQDAGELGVKSLLDSHPWGDQLRGPQGCAKGPRGSMVELVPYKNTRKSYF